MQHPVSVRTGYFMKYTLEHLIAEVEKIVTEPYCEWEIGVCNDDKMDDEGCVSTAVFNPNNNEAVLSAYNHFKSLGMAAKQPIPSETKYLFLFKNSWAKNIEVNF